jgi:hypothetical protein
VWIAAIVCACDGATATPDAPLATLAPDAAIDRTCVIENVLARNGSSLVTSSCGDLPIDADDASIQAAHDCALAAAAQQRSFLVLWEAQGTDSRIAYAYMGIEDEGHWVLSSYNYDGDPGGGGSEKNPHTFWFNCDALEELAPCSTYDRITTLCIQCAPAHPAGHCP